MRRLLKRIIPLLAIALVISCGGNSTGPDNNDSGNDNSGSDDSGPTTGTVEIATSTSGDDQDSDGYTLTLGDTEQDISLNDTATFEELEEGSYDAELAGIAENCSVDGDNPRTVDVTAGETASTTFNISCENKGENKIVYGLRKMDPDGNNEEVIKEREGAESYPEISHDGSKIAFIDDGTSTEKIYVINVDGTNLREIEINDLILNFPGSLSWSPDDSKLVFGNYDASNGNEIYIVNVETGEITQVTDNEYHDVSPDWSPDGNEILFSSAGGDGTYGNNDLYIYHTGDGSVQQLTDNEFNDTDPTWSPNGDKIAFSSDRDGEGVYTMDADGSNIQKINDQENRSITWSPDGQKLLYIYSVEDGYGGYDKLFKINADGSGEKVQIYRNSSAYVLTEPDWGILKPQN